MKKYFFLVLFCSANSFIPFSAKGNLFQKISASDPVKKIVKEIACDANFNDGSGKNQDSVKAA